MSVCADSAADIRHLNSTYGPPCPCSAYGGTHNGDYDDNWKQHGGAYGVLPKRLHGMVTWDPWLNYRPYSLRRCTLSVPQFSQVSWSWIDRG